MGTLSGYITRNAPLPTSQCQFFCGNIILAVEFIHKQGLVHGDVKADNLFMGADGYLMLGDLGMARRHDIDDAQWRRIGTMQFIPPEFIIDLPIDQENRRHIDWWGLACILYEMATGRLASHCMLLTLSCSYDVWTDFSSLSSSGRTSAGYEGWR